MSRHGKDWTTVEVRLLRKHYPIGGVNECLKHIHRSRSAIHNKAWLLCIAWEKHIEPKSEPHEWNAAADERIRALYAGERAKGDVSRLADELGATPDSVSNRARRLGVVKGHFWVREEAA